MNSSKPFVMAARSAVSAWSPLSATLGLVCPDCAAAPVESSEEPPPQAVRGEISAADAAIAAVPRSRDEAALHIPGILVFLGRGRKA
jgi:hypothetical protein